MVESLCCRAESNTTLYVNYVSIKKLKLKKKRQREKNEQSYHQCCTLLPAQAWG